MNNILKLFNQEEIYELQLASKQAVWQQTDQINSSKILYLPELQKAMANGNSKSASIIELIKNITEGKDAKRIVTNARRDGVDSYTIESGKIIVSTIAKENDFKYDRETQRRFLILETDSSKEHIKDIIDSKVSRQINVDMTNHKQEIEDSIKERVEYVGSLKNVHVLNPFIGYIKNAFPLVDKTQSYLDHYLNIFSAWGKFFSPERKSFTVNNEKFVLLNLEDVYNVFTIYQPHFMRTIRSFNEGVEIPDFYPNWSECYKEGVKAAKESLNILLDEGTVNIGKNFETLIGDWNNEQVKDGKVYVVDYKTGTKKIIADLSYEKITNPKRLLSERIYDASK